MLMRIQRRGMMRASRALKAAYGNKAGGILFTPGPLSTTERVREKLGVDYGSRDTLFIEAVKEVRQGVLKVAGVSSEDYTMIPMQGSGSMGMEAVVSTMIPIGGKIVIFRNGAYGDRLNAICKRLGIETVFYDGAEDQPIPLDKAAELLKQHPDASMVSMVHCETSTGVMNPIQGLRDLMRQYTPEATYFVDAMSSFGGVQMDCNELDVDVLVSSSNKCIQGVPGFSIVVVKKAKLRECEERCRSYTLDLCMQAKGLDQSGQFNNTPPVQVIMAFNEALKELEDEGGVPAREARYKQNQQIVTKGLQNLGFETYLDSSSAAFGHIITSFRFPSKDWDFSAFYNKLNDLGFVIYPGKAARAACFRIGHIGDIKPEDSHALVAAIADITKSQK